MPEEDVFNDDIDVAADIPENPIVNEYLSKISIGDVETLDFGESAYVTNTGTEKNPVLNFGLPRGASGTIWGQLDGLLSDQTDLQAALDAKDTAIATKADANNAILTGTPTAPTAVSSTNNTQIATTAFVQNAISILSTSLTTSLQSYVQSYVNSAVANMLRRMNYNNAVSYSVYRDHPYTCPSDGYIFISHSGSEAISINGKGIFTTSTETQQCPIPVSQGDVISNNVGINQERTIMWFVPMR